MPDSDFVASLRDEGQDRFTTFLLDQLDYALKQHSKAEADSPEEKYWQGRKDAMRIVVACHLNEPNIADHNRTNWWGMTHPEIVAPPAD